jgi:hypothetical protein
VGERRYAFEVEDIDKAKTYLAKKDFETLNRPGFIGDRFA